ncbi:hypothetical protein T11_12631 [Trichinella zimbabwensis]|uniref:Uncharacterized protein n=1 Tax=Trichinella zimbabwensis TaxID=268475 RepID=A0A0V1I314_9BILA|nr:hypothetical protein T11_12631 [Trichinella zimbabwensis]
MATVKCHESVLEVPTSALRRYKGSLRVAGVQLMVLRHGIKLTNLSYYAHWFVMGNERETISTVNLIWCQKIRYSPLAAT